MIKGVYRSRCDLSSNHNNYVCCSGFALLLLIFLIKRVYLCAMHVKSETNNEENMFN